MFSFFSDFLLRRRFFLLRTRTLSFSFLVFCPTELFGFALRGWFLILKRNEIRQHVRHRSHLSRRVCVLLLCGQHTDTVIV